MTASILVVDDRSNWIRSLERQLGSGYEVLSAKSYDEARKLLSENKFEMVITNWNLEDKGVADNLGAAVIDLVQQDYPQMPCVVWTGVVYYENIRARYPRIIVVRKVEDDVSRLVDVIRRVVEEEIPPLLLRLAEDLKLDVCQVYSLINHPRVAPFIERVKLSQYERSMSDLEAFAEGYSVFRGESDIHAAIVQAREIKIERNRQKRAVLQKEKQKLIELVKDFESSFVPPGMAEKRAHKRRIEALWRIRSQLGEFAASGEATGESESPGEARNNVEEYTDFELRIGANYIIQARSEEGERQAEISGQIPEEIQIKLDSLKRRSQTQAGLLKDLGEWFFSYIFPPPIYTHFCQTEAAARSRNQKIRVRLMIEPDALASLPWEFAYRAETGYFLATNPATVLSRYLDLGMPPGYVGGQAKPLHMLVIIANPISDDQVQLAPLDPDKWENIITRALASAIKEGLVKVDTVKQATYEEISDALLGRPPDIVQFVGHGVYKDGKGYLALVDSKAGNAWIVDDERFANIFLSGNDHLGLVCLAACESAASDSLQGFLGIAPKIVQRGIPAVVAMQYPVLVSTAEIFLENFYKAIAARKPVDWAVQHARNAISIKQGLDNREFATPVLFMRAKDGNIF